MELPDSSPSAQEQAKLTDKQDKKVPSFACVHSMCCELCHSCKCTAVHILP